MRRQHGADFARGVIIPAAMKTQPSIKTIGLDLGDRRHSVCVLDHQGGILREETITNTRASLTALSRRHPGALVVMEVGMHSPWTSRFFQQLGHRVLVANPRKVRAIYQNERKCDPLNRAGRRTSNVRKNFRS